LHDQGIIHFMKIVIFADIFLPHIDGVTNSLVHLVKEYVRQGHEVLVMAPKLKGSEKVEIRGVKIIFLPSIPAVVYPELMLGLFSRELFKELKRFSPEVVHVIGPGSVGSMGLFYSKLVGIKSVAAFHGYFMEPEYLSIMGIKNRGVEMAQKMLWKLAKTFYDRADSVVTPSNFVKKDLLDHDFVGPIKVINNAINFSNISLDKKQQSAFLKKYSLEGCKIALYVGRVSVEKNIELLIKSFPEVIKKVPKSRLVIVGDGPDMESLKSLVSKLGMERDIVFTGKVENAELVKKGIFKLAQVFVTASHSEVQPVSIIEAMNFGLPVIASKSRGLTEMIKGNGYLVSGNNKKKFSEYMIKILSDNHLQKKMSQESTRLVNKYSLESSAKKHIDLYKKLSANNKSRKTIKQFLKSRIS
jgi:1,2-diacylglycerol 3-alpha-glucosyltransferase